MGANPPAQYDRLAVDLRDAMALGDPDQRIVSELASDAALGAAAHIQHFGANGRLVVGKVITALPYLHWYRVFLEDADSDYPCCLGSLSNFQPIGTRSASMILPDNDVLVYKHKTLHYGIILCALPPITQDGSLVTSDWSVQGSNTGFKREGYHHEPLSILYGEGGAIDFSAGRPVDGTMYDQGFIDELGGRLLMNQFLKQLAIDEQTGLFLFYDQLARLTGRHMDVRSACHEFRSRDDESETHLYYGEAMYPYEALGAYRKGVTVSREVSDEDVHYNAPEGKYEPSEADQTPFHRYREWGGYLGQGKIRQIVVPHPESTQLCRLEDDKPPVTLFHEQTLPTTLRRLSQVHHFCQAVDPAIHAAEAATGGFARRLGR